MDDLYNLSLDLYTLLQELTQYSHSIDSSIKDLRLSRAFLNRLYTRHSNPPSSNETETFNTTTPLQSDVVDDNEEVEDLIPSLPDKPIAKQSVRLNRSPYQQTSSKATSRPTVSSHRSSSPSVQQRRSSSPTPKPTSKREPTPPRKAPSLSPQDSTENIAVVSRSQLSRIRDGKGSKPVLSRSNSREVPVAKSKLPTISSKQREAGWKDTLPPQSHPQRGLSPRASPVREPSPSAVSSSTSGKTTLSIHQSQYADLIARTRELEHHSSKGTIPNQTQSTLFTFSSESDMEYPFPESHHQPNEAAVHSFDTFCTRLENTHSRIVDKRTQIERTHCTNTEILPSIDNIFDLNYEYSQNKQNKGLDTRPQKDLLLSQALFTSLASISHTLKEVAEIGSGKKSVSHDVLLEAEETLRHGPDIFAELSETLPYLQREMETVKMVHSIMSQGSKEREKEKTGTEATLSVPNRSIPLLPQTPTIPLHTCIPLSVWDALSPHLGTLQASLVSQGRLGRVVSLPPRDSLSLFIESVHLSLLFNPKGGSEVRKAVFYLHSFQREMVLTWLQSHVHKKMEETLRKQAKHTPFTTLPIIKMLATLIINWNETQAQVRGTLLDNMEVLPNPKEHERKARRE